MKKKKIIKILIPVLIVITTIIIINKLTNNSNDNTQKKLSNIYEELQTTQTYFFEMERNDENKVIIAKKGSNTLIDQYSEEFHVSTIVKDNKTYLVLHDREEYLVYGQDNIEQNILLDGLKEVIDKTFTTGTEKIRGEKYSYEEYSGSTIFTISNTLDENEEDVKTRFFFDKDNNLVYIKTMTADAQELLKVKLQKEVDDSIFEIPSNYAEN